MCARTKLLDILEGHIVRVIRAQRIADFRPKQKADRLEGAVRQACNQAIVQKTEFEVYICLEGRVFGLPEHNGWFQGRHTVAQTDAVASINGIVAQERALIAVGYDVV